MRQARRRDVWLTTSQSHGGDQQAQRANVGAVSVSVRVYVGSAQVNGVYEVSDAGSIRCEVCVSQLAVVARAPQLFLFTLRARLFAMRGSTTAFFKPPTTSVHCSAVTRLCTPSCRERHRTYAKGWAVELANRQHRVCLSCLYLKERALSFASNLFRRETAWTSPLGLARPWTSPFSVCAMDVHSP
jgi:hypothetical protein